MYNGSVSISPKKGVVMNRYKKEEKNKGRKFETTKLTEKEYRELVNGYAEHHSGTNGQIPITKVKGPELPKKKS